MGARARYRPQIAEQFLTMLDWETQLWPIARVGSLRLHTPWCWPTCPSTCKVADLRGSSQEHPGRVWRGQEERNVGIWEGRADMWEFGWWQVIWKTCSQLWKQIRGRMDLVLILTIKRPLHTGSQGFSSGQAGGTLALSGFESHSEEGK